MIETVRILMLDNSYRFGKFSLWRKSFIVCFRPDYTVIFVAFDKKHDGSIGSRKFIEDYLEPNILNKYRCSVQGVINIGSVLKYSTFNNSQKFPASFYEANPQTSYKIMSQGGKGDFLAAIHRGLGFESYLADTLKSHLQSQGYRQESFSFSKLATKHHLIENIGEFEFDEFVMLQIV